MYGYKILGKEVLALTPTGSVKIAGSINATGSVTIRESLITGENPIVGESGGYFNVGNSSTANYSSISFYSIDDTDQDSFGKVSINSNPEDGVALLADSYNNTNTSRLTLTKGNLSILTATSSISSSNSIVVRSPNVRITGSLLVTGSYFLNGNKLYNYGQFSSTETQSGSANTAYAMKLNTTDFTSGITVANNGSGFPTRITAANTGLYNLQFSAQLGNTANTVIDFDIWFAYTGSNIANSNTQLHLNKVPGSTGAIVAAWNFMTPIQANDYVEIMWSCNAATGQLQAVGTQTVPTRPAVPSVIATVTQVA